MPTDREYVIRREELYEKAWSIPMARLAKEYGISDVALAKICKKLNVPKPQRGYWAKLSANKELKRPLLPKISSSDQKEFIHYERPKPPQDSELDAIKNDIVARKRNISVSDNLDNPHRLVQRAYSILRREKPSENGLLYARRHPCLDIRVSPANLERALRIMDALIKGFETENYKVAVKGDPIISTHVLIEDEKICLLLNERVHRVDHVLTPEEKKELKKSSYWTPPKFDYHPAGELSLRIEAKFGIQRKWADTITEKIEKKLGDVIAHAILAARQIKMEEQRRIEFQNKQEEERRRRWEEEKRQAEENAQFEKLEKQVETWAKSERIRGFIQAVEKAIADKNLPEEERKGVDAWLSWARKQADKRDPIKLSFPD